MSKLSPPGFYQLVADDYALPIHRAFYQHIAECLLKKVPNRSFKSILEVGAGTGFATAKIAERFPESRITALEPASAMLSQAKSRIPEIDWVNGRLPALTAERFDLAFASMSYHWLNADERQKLLDISANGILVLALSVTGGPNRSNGNRALKRLLIELRGETNWPKQVRTESALAATINNRFAEVLIDELVVSESFSSAAEFIDCLYVRGSLFSLFGDRTKAAVDRLARLLAHETSVRFDWSIRLIVGAQGGLTPSAFEPSTIPANIS